MKTLVPDGLTVERVGHVLTIWLDRPDQRNALTVAMRSALLALVEEGDRDPEVRVVVLRGRGGNFCAGADLNRVEGDMKGDDTVTRIHAGAEVLHRIAATSTPTIAVVEGYALAGGFELMLACDLVVASHDAKIGDFHVNRGLVGGAGPLYRLPRLVGPRRARELMLTGMTLSGREAHEWGLVNRVAGESDLDDVVVGLVTAIASKSPLAVGATNQALERSLETDSRTMTVIERSTVERVFTSDDAKEGVRAFLERREPQWTGR